MKNRSSESVTLEDILSVLHQFSTNVDERFNTVDRRFEKTEAELFAMRMEIGSVKEDLTTVKRDVAEVKDKAVAMMDDLASFRQTFDVELAAVRSRFGRLEARASSIEGFMRIVAERLSLPIQVT